LIRSDSLILRMELNKHKWKDYLGDAVVLAAPTLGVFFVIYKLFSSSQIWFQPA